MSNNPLDRGRGRGRGRGRAHGDSSLPFHASGRERGAPAPQRFSTGRQDQRGDARGRGRGDRGGFGRGRGGPIDAQIFK